MTDFFHTIKGFDLRTAIRIQPVLSDLMIVVSVSGGKDSTALILVILEMIAAGVIRADRVRFVFADTQWEADETYAYLDFLRARLNVEIDVVGVDGGMEARCRHRAGFPGRQQRFCTRELKIEPIRKYHDAIEEETGLETVSVMGIRADESESREKMLEWDDEGPRYTRERWGGYVWRPLIAWTVTDVLAIHSRHAIPVNPLYRLGHNRVGCYPCIYENKEGIALIAEHAPKKIDKIDNLERELVQLRIARNAEKPGRYAHEDDASFFQTQRQGFSGIRKVVTWAQTAHGGHQLHLLPPPPKGGCMRWGVCDIAPPPLADGLEIAHDALIEECFDDAMAINLEVLDRMVAERKLQGTAADFLGGMGAPI